MGKALGEVFDILHNAVLIYNAGTFTAVHGCGPELVAVSVTDTLNISTIMIGTGLYCSGQIPLCHDLLGITKHSQHAQFAPRFSKQYVDLVI